MSDNVAITPGSGATVAADLVGGVLYQRVKISLGADGVVADAPGEGTNGLDVDVTRLPSLVAGSANIGDVDVLTVIPGVTATSLGKSEDAAHTSGDTGVAILGRRIDTPASSAGTSGDYATIDTDASGRLWTRSHSVTGTVTSQTDQATNVTLLAANAARVGATIYNDSTVVLYVKFGATASATSFTVKLQAEDYFEVPYGYTGIIDGIWASDASGSARITELV